MGDGLLARLNAAAGMIAKGARVSDFSNLELAYAPPFSTAVDVLNAAANVADNLLDGRLKVISVEEFVDWMDGKVDHPDWMALDLRHPKETEPWVKAFPERWYALVYDKVRANYESLPKDKTFIIICNAGTRSYEIQLFLQSKGVENTYVLPGGLNVIRRLGVSWWQ